jgi:hypothetical protein
MQQGPWIVGTAAEVRDNLAQLQEELGLEELTIFPHYPGLVREQVVDQLQRFMAEVAPTLRRQAERIEQAPPGRVDLAGAATSPITMAQARTRETIAANRS